MSEQTKHIEVCQSEQVGAEIVNAATGDKFDALVTEALTGEQPAQPYTSWIVEFKSLLILLLRKLYYTPLSLFSNTSIKDFIAGLQATIVTLQAAIASMLGDIATSYQKVSDKGGTLPQEQTSANLPTAIESIPSGVPDYNTYLAGCGISDVAQLYMGTVNRPKILYSPNVTEIRYFLDPSLFYGNEGIREVNFPNCTSIRINNRGVAFAYNGTLSKIVLPSLIEIGLYDSHYGLFSSMRSIRYVELGAVTSLWQNSELNIFGDYAMTTSYYAYDFEMFKMGNGWNVPLNLRNWFGTNVSADTIDANVRSGLADTCRDNTGATAKTIKFNSNLYVKLSEETKQIFTDKNWILQAL